MPKIGEPFRDRTALETLMEGERQAQAQLRSMMGVDPRLEALEKRVYKLEDVVNEILRRSAGIGKRVGTVQDLDGEDRAERIREGSQEGESSLGASVDLGGSERPDTGGDGNTSSL